MRNMSRVDELKAAGATVLGDNSEGPGDKLGPTPFIKWPAAAPPVAWIEGTVEEIWEGKYGKNATIIATGCSGGLVAGGSDTVSYLVEKGLGQKFNVGLASATLKDRVTDEHIGEVLHFAFLGWSESANGGNRYRNFEIQVVPPELQRLIVEGKQEALVQEATQLAGEIPVEDDDKLPF